MGGFSVDNATLTRFFAFHFLLPFIVAAITMIHLIFLHQTGSNNPAGINSDADKISPTNPLVTPPHIKPEWYFLFAYAILRSIPNKLGGVLALLFSILILMLVPILHTSKQRGITFRPVTQFLF